MPMLLIETFTPSFFERLLASMSGRRLLNAKKTIATPISKITSIERVVFIVVPALLMFIKPQTIKIIFCAQEIKKRGEGKGRKRDSFISASVLLCADEILSFLKEKGTPGGVPFGNAGRGE